MNFIIRVFLVPWFHAPIQLTCVSPIYIVSVIAVCPCDRLVVFSRHLLTIRGTHIFSSFISYYGHTFTHQTWYKVYITGRFFHQSLSKLGFFSILYYLFINGLILGFNFSSLCNFWSPIYHLLTPGRAYRFLYCSFFLYRLRLDYELFPLFINGERGFHFLLDNLNLSFDRICDTSFSA